MLSFHNLTLGYNRHPAVHHLNAVVKKGDFIALVGPNGAGKSTLMKSILGYVEPMEGSIQFEGINAKDISYLPQSSAVDRTFPITVQQFVATGLWQETGLFQKMLGGHKKRVSAALNEVGLAGCERRTLDALSGGQFQRLLFARKLVQNARLLLLDEPFSGVDEQTIEDLMAILHRLHSEGATIVAVVHNVALVKAHFPKTLLLSRELIGIGNTDEVLTEENIRLATQVGFGDPIVTTVCEVGEHV